MVVAVVAAVFVAVVCFVAGLVVAWLDAVVACLADPVAWFVVVAAHCTETRQPFRKVVERTLPQEHPPRPHRKLRSNDKKQQQEQRHAASILSAQTNDRSDDSQR